VTFLDLVEVKLKAKRYKFVRLDGKMAQKDRQESIHRFNTKRSVRVFLISLRAGGLGINLVAANRVFLMDPWWNVRLASRFSELSPLTDSFSLPSSLPWNNKL